MRSKSFCLAIGFMAGMAQAAEVAAGADVPYPNMPQIAPIGVRIGDHLAIPADAKGPPVDPAKGYRLEQLGDGLYMITDNAYQSMFMVYEDGVIVVDAPPSYAARIVEAIREVSNKPITHLVYSHSHVDHIAGAKSLGAVTTIIAQEETKRLVAHDVLGYFAQVEEIRKVPFKTFVGGHVARTGTPADVERQLQFISDLKEAASRALASTRPGEGLDAATLSNPWAVFDVYIWDQCYSMEQSLRID